MHVVHGKVCQVTFCQTKPVTEPNHDILRFKILSVIFFLISGTAFCLLSLTVEPVFSVVL